MEEERRGWIVLPGHRDVGVRVQVVRYSPSARAVRTLLYAVCCAVATVVTFFVTIFDPFLSSIPLVVGLAATRRCWKGCFRIVRFDGECPRCSEPIPLREGTRIGSPHPLVCYTCHHEPELHLAG